MLWMDWFGPSAPVNKPSGARAAGQTAPGVPQAEGSMIEVHPWTHEQDPGPAKAADYMLPQLDVYSLGAYGLLAGEEHWPDDTGYLEFSRVAIETVQTPSRLGFPKSAQRRSRSAFMTVRPETAQEALSQPLKA